MELGIYSTYRTFFRSIFRIPHMARSHFLCLEWPIDQLVGAWPAGWGLVLLKHIRFFEQPSKIDAENTLDIWKLWGKHHWTSILETLFGIFLVVSLSLSLYIYINIMYLGRWSNDCNFHPAFCRWPGTVQVGVPWPVSEGYLLPIGKSTTTNRWREYVFFGGVLKQSDFFHEKMMGEMMGETVCFRFFLSCGQILGRSRFNAPNQIAIQTWLGDVAPL